MRRPGRRRGSVHRLLPLAVALATVAAGTAMLALHPREARASTDPDPIAQWAMDEGSGSTAADAGSLAADLSMATPVWVADGHTGSALRFTGSNGATASAADLHTTDLTVSLWVRGDPDHRPVDGSVIAELGGRAGCGHATWGLYVDGSSFHFGWQDAGASQFFATEGWAVEGHDLWDGSWHHIAVAISAAPYAYILQRIDGYTSGGTQMSPDLDYSGIVLDDLTLGQIAGNCSGPPQFRGDIDDLRIYDEALTSDQIGGLEPPIATTAVLTGPNTALTGESPCFDLDVTGGPVGGDLDIAITPSGGEAVHHMMTWQYPGHSVICLSVVTGSYDVSASFSNGRPWVSAATNVIHLDVAKRTSATFVDGRVPQLSTGPLMVDGFVDGNGVIPTGDVSFYEVVDGVRVPLGGGTLTYTGTDQRSVATLALSPRAPGTYTFAIDYPGDSDHLSATGGGTIAVTAPDGDPADTTPPIATAPTWFVMSGLSLDAGRPKLRLIWSGSDDSSGIDHFEIAQSTDAGPFVQIGSQAAPWNMDRLISLGHTYRFRVRAIDVAGNVGAWSYGPTSRFAAISQSIPAVRYHGSWSTATSSTSFWGGTSRASSIAGATVSYTFAGRSITWVGLESRTRGKAQISINGVLKATVDLWSSTLRTKHLIWQTTFASSATRTITIKVLGTAGRPRVDIDGFIVGS
jgi:hypothetical protein